MNRAVLAYVQKTILFCEAEKNARSWWNVNLLLVVYFVRSLLFSFIVLTVKTQLNVYFRRLEFCVLFDFLQWLAPLSIKKKDIFQSHKSLPVLTNRPCLMGLSFLYRNKRSLALLTSRDKYHSTRGSAPFLSCQIGHASWDFLMGRCIQFSC